MLVTLKHYLVSASFVMIVTTFAPFFLFFVNLFVFSCYNFRPGYKNINFACVHFVLYANLFCKFHIPSISFSFEILLPHFVNLSQYISKHSSFFFEFNLSYRISFITVYAIFLSLFVIFIGIYRTFRSQFNYFNKDCYKRLSRPSYLDKSGPRPFNDNESIIFTYAGSILFALASGVLSLAWVNTSAAFP